MLSRLFNITLLCTLFTIPPFLSQAQTPELEIWQIQGNAGVSPHQGRQVSTTANIITAVGDGFFFMQCPESRSDQDPATSDGIYVAYNQSSIRKTGDLVKVKATVLEVDGRTQLGQGDVQITFLEGGQKLPQAIELDEAFPSGAARSLPEMEAVEGMLVHFKGLTTGPSDYRNMAPVVARQQRPFREAGIRYPGLPALPVWDGNPEIFWLLPDALGAPQNRFIIAGAAIEAEGPVSQSGSEYILFPAAYTLGDTPAGRPVRPALEDEITIAGLNARRLDGSEPNFDQKLKKLARYIFEMLQGPDLIALQEIGSLSALSDLRFFIRQLDPSLDYTPFFLEGNDDIHLAFLAREDIFRNIRVEQLGKSAKLSIGGMLFDRPPLLFTAEIAGTPATQLNILNLHLRSLMGIEGDEENYVRRKRYEQSLAVTELVAGLREENLLVVGDFNAYAFSDGYVDVLSQICGHPSLGAQYMPEMILDHPLQILSKDLPPEEQYSYVFDGSAQQIDHALAGALEGLAVQEMAFARANADFPDTYAPNDQLVYRASDHDAFVVYLKTERPSAAIDRQQWRSVKIHPNPICSGAPFFVDQAGVQAGDVQIFSSAGRLVWAQDQYLLHTPVTTRFPAPGIYHFLLRSGSHLYRQKLVVLPGN